MATAKKVNPLDEALQEIGDDLFGAGVIDAGIHAKITMREVAADQVNAEAISPVEIKALRQRHHLSQGALGHYINVSSGYVSQMERGIRRPSGPALVLLNVIRRKGLDAIL